MRKWALDNHAECRGEPTAVDRHSRAFGAVAVMSRSWPDLCLRGIRANRQPARGAQTDLLHSQIGARPKKFLINARVDPALLLAFSEPSRKDRSTSPGSLANIARRARIGASKACRRSSSLAFTTLSPTPPAT